MRGLPTGHLLAGTFSGGPEARADKRFDRVLLANPRGRGQGCLRARVPVKRLLVPPCVAGIERSGGSRRRHALGFKVALLSTCLKPLSYSKIH